MRQNQVRLRRDVGLFIRRARTEKSLTGEELGRRLNLSQQQISRYENGMSGMNIETLDAILRALDVDWYDFFLRVMSEHSEKITGAKFSYPV